MSAWVVVARIPQIDGGIREVLVEQEYAREVREVLHRDPARIDGLWCETRTRTLEARETSGSEDEWEEELRAHDDEMLEEELREERFEQLGGDEDEGEEDQVQS